MSLYKIIIIGTSITTGCTKGIADQSGIELGLFDYIIPVTGIIAPTIISNISDKNNNNLLGGGIAYGTITGASYVVSRGITAILQHYIQ